MKKILLVLPVTFSLAACETRDQNTLAGAAAGAAVGAVIDGSGKRTEGVLIGTAIGATIGANLNTGAKGNCVYERPDGSRYTATCP